MRGAAEMGKQRRAEQQQERSSTHDYAEGVTPFLEKRPPKYTGR